MSDKLEKIKMNNKKYVRANLNSDLDMLSVTSINMKQNPLKNMELNQALDQTFADDLNTIAQTATATASRADKTGTLSPLQISRAGRLRSKDAPEAVDSKLIFTPRRLVNSPQVRNQ